MRRASLSTLQGHEVLAKAIFDEEGRILLREGIIIKTTFINKLQALGITYVYIEDEVSQGIEINDVVSEETRQQSKKAIAETAQKFIRRGDISLQGIVTAAEKVIDDILSQKEVMINLVDIRAKEDVLFSHSVNVSILSVMTGCNMGYNMAKLKELAVGALLHDMGIISIMKETHPGSGKFELDKSRYQEHPKLGYDILNKQSSISSFVKIIALTHHEKMDGTGYPFGLKADEIHEMVRIVSVCNAFDSIMHNNRMLFDVPPYQAIEFLEASPDIFDTNIVKHFTANVSLYPSGMRVRLNTGEPGIVCRQNKVFPSRPVVRLLSVLNKDVEVDLSQTLNIFIEEVYED